MKTLDEQIEILEEMLHVETERGFLQEIRAVERTLKDFRQQRARQGWREQWPADGNVPPENDYLTAKPAEEGVGEESAVPRRDRGIFPHAR